VTTPTLPVARSTPRATAVASGCAVLFLLPFAAVGVYATIQLAGAVTASSWAQAGHFAIFALVFG